MRAARVKAGSWLKECCAVPKWYRRGVAMNLRLTDELSERLREQAAAEHTSVQSLLTKAAEEYLARHTKRALIDSAMDDVMVSFGDALRRLGE